MSILRRCFAHASTVSMAHALAGGDVYGRVPPKEPSSNITCPSCGRAVGAARYAPHLDKCALGPTRGRASRARFSVRETRYVTLCYITLRRAWLLHSTLRVLCLVPHSS